MPKPPSPQMKRIQAQLLKERAKAKSALDALNKARASSRANQRQSQAQIDQVKAERTAARRATTQATKQGVKNVEAEQKGRAMDRVTAGVIGGVGATAAAAGGSVLYQKYNEQRKANENLQNDLRKANEPKAPTPSSWWADRKREGRGY
jgi:hypothetical protein